MACRVVTRRVWTLLLVLLKTCTLALENVVHWIEGITIFWMCTIIQRDATRVI